MSWFDQMKQKPMATKKRRTIFVTENTPNTNDQRLVDWYRRTREAEKREAKK